uniref:ribonuclease H n=1 Tax=Paramormyrops kingsleyae TaxID=1676925 RepID=A0A3B3S6A7_9TELE
MYAASISRGSRQKKKRSERGEKKTFSRVCINLLFFCFCQRQHASIQTSSSPLLLDLHLNEDADSAYHSNDFIPGTITITAASSWRLAPTPTQDTTLPIIPCVTLNYGGPGNSKYITPILPVEKAGSGKYRMAHDLRAVNNLLLTPTVPVPNPYVALTNLTPHQKWFTCIDLANAFFCLPLAEECRDIFSFTYRGCQLRYTRLPQGFALSPGIFNQVLKQALEGCPLPDGVTLVQYVDDLLIAAPSAEAALQGTRAVLLQLSDRGFKVSPNKSREPHQRQPRPNHTLGSGSC